MHRAGRVEPLIVIGEGDAERSEANAGRLDVGEDEGGGGREDIGAFAHLVWATGIHATCSRRGHVVVHGITAQLGKAVARATENRLLCRTTVDFGDADVAREGGFPGIDQKTGIAETRCVAVDGGFNPAESAVITAAKIEGDVAAVVIHIHGPGEIELFVVADATGAVSLRSEERRVGKEGRSCVLRSY